MTQNIAKYAAYGIGGLTLVGGSFLIVAAVTGTPLNKLRGIGGLFPEEPKAALSVEDEKPELEVELENDTRSAEQVFDSARSPLTAFVLQDPFSAEELSQLENRLQIKMDELEKRSRALDEREALLDLDAEHVERLRKDLERLRSGLLTESDEQRSEALELEANRKESEAREAEIYKRLALQFEDGEPATVAPQLMNVYEPDEAAKILKNLPDDRVSEILSAIHTVNQEKHRLYQRAYQNALGD